MTGWFEGPITFGAGESNETVLQGTEGGWASLFVAKYAPDGSLLWAKQAGGEGYSYGAGIAVDAAGNSLVTGRFVFSTTFAAGELHETVLTTAFENMFVAKYAPDGSLLWAKQPEHPADDPYPSASGQGIAVDAARNSLVTGYFYGPTTFGAAEPNETELSGRGIFVAKYAPDGSLRWARQVGGDSGTPGSGITVDAADNSVVIGSLSGSATFGAGELNETVLTSVGGEDVFVAKYAPNGSLVWAKQAGGEGDSFGTGVAVDTAGNSLVTGLLGGTTTFGAGEPNETVLPGAEYGWPSLFVAKYARQGSLLWAKQAGGEGDSFGTGIAVDAAGNSLVTGRFDGLITLGAGEPNETVLTAAVRDMFVAKYAP